MVYVLVPKSDTHLYSYVCVCVCVCSFSYLSNQIFVNPESSF